MKTFATMFTGFGGADVGLMNAGLSPLWGVEYDADIADVYRQNIGDHVIVSDVRTVDYAALPAVDWLHASPSCVRASVANVDATEAHEDIETAQAVVRALMAHKPQVFTLENVWGYRNFAAFRLILDTIGSMGYFYDFEHVNAADYGVPQTRRRLILRATRGLLPPLPLPVEWVGWYAAIADLLPTLPDSKLAPWQLARLPEDVKETLLVGSGNTNKDAVTDIPRGIDAPAYTVLSSMLRGSKALLVDGKLGSESTNMTTRDGEARCFTVTTSHNQRDMRALLVNGDNGSRDLSLLPESVPCFTVRDGYRTTSRVVTPHRVVAMTPRCLARFQSFPDWYQLPDKRSLAAKGIGNAVPPLLMQRIAEGLIF